MRSSQVALAVIVTIASPAATAGQFPPGVTSIPFAYEVIPNVTYVHRKGWEGKLDLLLPSDRTSTTPTVVWFHGGGWTRSSKERELLYVLPYLYRRWSVINVEYRLAHVAKAPAAASDALCAMRWLPKHAQEYDVHLDHLVISGISAGGTMAMIAGTTPASSPLAHECGPDTEFGALPVPRVIVNWFGPSNLVDLIQGPHRQPQVARWFDGVPNPLNVARALSPVMYIDSRIAALITIHGARDADVPYAQSVALHALLDRLGSPNRLVKVQAGHGDFTPAQAEHAYDQVFQYIDEVFRN